MISQIDAYASLEVAEVNPILDDRNKTAEFAAEIIASSMGKRIL
jgi:arginase